MSLTLKVKVWCEDDCRGAVGYISKLDIKEHPSWNLREKHQGLVPSKMLHVKVFSTIPRSWSVVEQWEQASSPLLTG